MKHSKTITRVIYSRLTLNPKYSVKHRIRVKSLKSKTGFIVDVRGGSSQVRKVKGRWRN